MPVHDMTRAAAGSIVGQPAIGTAATCAECGYGTVSLGGDVPLVVHSARCPRVLASQRDGLPLPPFVACRLTSCKRVLDPARVANGATACNERHKTAAWKAEHSYGRHDAQGQGGRSNGSQRPAKPSGLQISYLQAVSQVAAYLDDPATSNHPADPLRAAEELLRPVLSERQRAQLEARERSNDANDR
jgi:hypothetical protein